MSTEATGDDKRKDERELCARFVKHLERLQGAGRCEWAPQVRMLHWRHAQDAERAIVRIDYVARMDGGPLIGLEAKKAPAKAADLGRYLKQCSDYADSVIAGSTTTPQAWVGRPLKAVFLVVEIENAADYIRQHYMQATRLMGPFNVGFVRRRHDGLQLYLCDEENWWCEAWGYSAHAMSRNSNRRVGNGSFKLDAVEAWPR
jgi:hypothetical protein